jgi:3-oxoadipate enol-lactonase
VDLRPSLKSIRNPTLVMVGELDAATPPALAAELVAGIPDAKLVQIPACGHCPPLEQPEAFLAAAMPFLGLK